MDKKIPIYFDAIVASPIERISDSDPNLGRLKVGVFTKYGNRNGSYITDAVAEQLIQSAVDHPTPVVGFFDPETQTWAGHTGPTLANGYGYVKSFEGWQPLQDTDGVVRDYAIFSVDMFTEYFDEATKVAGQNQSMELNIKSIDGDWANIEGNEYFVYPKARIQGLCIIGSHEPCFSVSAFFSKEDDNYKSQYDKFSSLLADLKARVEEAENGGEKTMDDNKFENQEIETPEAPAVEETVVQETEPVADFSGLTVVGQLSTEEEVVEVESETTVAAVEEVAEVEEPTNFEALYNELNAKYEQLTADYAAAQAQIAAITEQLTNAQTTEQSLRDTLKGYELKEQEYENTRKENLIQKYEKEINEPEEITTLRAQTSNFSYEELEGKLAILFANKKMADHDTKKVPLVEPQKSEFALLMEKYKR